MISWPLMILAVLCNIQGGSRQFYDPLGAIHKVWPSFLSLFLTPFPPLPVIKGTICCAAWLIPCQGYLSLKVFHFRNQASPQQVGEEVNDSELREVNRIKKP